MAIKISKLASDYKSKIEKEAGIRIFIEDREKHLRHKVKARSFVDGNTVFTDKNLSEEEMDRDLFHELTHVYLRYLGFPQVRPKKTLSQHENDVLDKVLSLAEDLFVEKYLAENEYPHSNFDYNEVFGKLRNIKQAGKYIDIGNKNLPDELKFVVVHLTFIRLMVDKNYRSSDKAYLKKVCIKNLGLDGWDKVKSVSKGIRDILGRSEIDQAKLDKMFRFLLRNFDLQDKVDIMFDNTARATC